MNTLFSLSLLLLLTSSSFLGAFVTFSPCVITVNDCNVDDEKLQPNPQPQPQAPDKDKK